MELDKIVVKDGYSPERDDDDVSDDADSSTHKAKERQVWGGQLEFVLSLVGYTVGLGNVWRFPFLCFRNGGGAFLIPFALFLLLCGGPLYYMEVCMGQFSGKSVFRIWDICPLMRGVGVTMSIVSILFMWSYALVFAWILYYLFQSFFPTLGWTTCSNDWNTEHCFDGSTERLVGNMTTSLVSNFTNLTVIGKGNYSAPAWEFWQYNVLNKSPGLEETGTVQWHLLASLFCGWLLVFLCLIKGIETLGKVVYVTVIGPYILLTILLVRGLTLDGAWDGLKVYLIPDFARLGDGQIWMEAAVQVFYSLGPAWGSIITMASFNKFHNNALRDTVVVCFFDIFTAFYGGLVVFSVIGFLSKKTGTPIDELPFGGPALAFIVYPEALGQLPMPQLWSVLFFLTLVFMGIDTQFGTFEVVSTVIIDMNYDKLHKYRIYVTASLVLCLFLLGIPFTCSNGMYIFQIIDWYMVTFNILIVSLLECCIISWIYGANRFSRDIETMLGKSPSVFMRLEWAIIAPLFLCTILMMNLIGYSPVAGEDGYIFPGSALVMGNIVAFGPLLPIILVAGYQLYKSSGTISERFRKCASPDVRWEPHDDESAEMYRADPYRYSRGACNRVVQDTFGIGKRTEI